MFIVEWFLANPMRLVYAAALAAGLFFLGRYEYLEHKTAAQTHTIAVQHKQIVNQRLSQTVVADEHKAEVTRNAKAAAIKKEIYSAPQTDDAPVAPVLRAAIDSLPIDSGN